MPIQFAATQRAAVTRRAVFAALPAGMIANPFGPMALAQPAAADPVSFYLGQVLALATLQAQAIGRLRPLLAAPAPGDANWLAVASAEAGIIGAVASVLRAMTPPPQLAGSVAELRQASDAYRAAAAATGQVAGGDAAALSAAASGLTQGAAHILLWLDALTAETGNDWGDGLRALAEAELPPPTAAAPAPASGSATASTPAPAAAAQEVVDVPKTPTPDAAGQIRQLRRKAKRQNGQS
jgi:hypothetical protein